MVSATRDLAGMRLDAVQVLVEGVVDAAEDLQGEGGRHAAQAQQLLGAEQGEGRQGGHGRGAVDQGDALLEAQSRRGADPPARAHARPGHQLALVEDVPLADDRQGHVRQVHEVAGGADAAALRDVGGDAAR